MYLIEIFVGVVLKFNMEFFVLKGWMMILFLKIILFCDKLMVVLYWLCNILEMKWVLLKVML